ncbi:unnamed protein product [Amoebophrya sp. A120]|nr:unnamed protein product [Amoebophrya sp. A120]|eukprot:GSA120T00021964001.1
MMKMLRPGDSLRQGHCVQPLHQRSSSARAVFRRGPIARLVLGASLFLNNTLCTTASTASRSLFLSPHQQGKEDNSQAPSSRVLFPHEQHLFGQQRVGATEIDDHDQFYLHSRVFTPLSRTKSQIGMRSPSSVAGKGAVVASAPTANRMNSIQPASSRPLDEVDPFSSTVFLQHPRTKQPLLLDQILRQRGGGGQATSCTTEMDYEHHAEVDEDTLPKINPLSTGFSQLFSWLKPYRPAIVRRCRGGRLYSACT